MEDSAKTKSESFALPLSASMVELKAELSRKKEEFRREKAANIHTVKGRTLEKISLKKKASVWDRKNSGVDSRAKRDAEVDKAEDEDVFMKSKSILEKKSKIYDAISSSGDIPDEDGSEGYLVDFQKKAVDSIVEERERRRREEEEWEEDEAEKKALAEPIPDPDSSDDEWVDYTDSLGRSRRCLKKDLKDIQGKDQDLAQSLHQRATTGLSDKPKEKHSDDPASLHLMSDDMHREKMRQKWESEAQQLLEKGQEEIHYSNVQYDEIRTHGVGFYQFSKDEGEREAQMEKLSKLREKTKDERSRKEKVKDKRKALMEARLAKVKERRKLKTKETPAEDEESDIGPKLSEARLEAEKKEEEMKKIKEEAEKAAEDVRKNHLREWDKKKVASGNSWIGDSYIDKRRHEREAEFAPPSLYFNKTNNHSTIAASKSEYRNKRNQPMYNQNVHPRTNANLLDKSDGFYCKQPFPSSSFAHTSDTSDFSTSTSSTRDRSATQQEKVATNSPMSSTAVPLDLDSIPLPNDRENTVVSLSGSNSDNAIEVTSRNTINHLGTTQFSSTDHSNHTNAHNQPVSYPYPCFSHTPAFQSSHDPLEFTPYPHQLMSSQLQQWPQHQSHPSPPISTLTQPPPPIPSMQAGYYYHQGQGYSASNQTNDVPLNQTAFTADVAALTRKSSSNIADSPVPTKKPKVPKSAIMDNRFMLNSKSFNLSASANDTSDLLSNIQAVPYKPGSFTNARFNQESQYEEPNDEVAKEPAKVEIYGGPMVYSKEKQLQQLQEMKDEQSSDTISETDQKVDEFLKSIRDQAM